MHALLTWVHGMGLRPLQSPLSLPGARRALRVNDEPGKNLNLLYFVYFFWKWAAAFEKPQFFTFGQKQCFYLTHSVREYFEKLALQKKQNTQF